jgi:hypothetical protein
MPRISVVLNVRNEAVHLAACLASCKGADDIIDADERLSDGGVEQLRALAATARPDISAFRLPFPTHLGSQLIRRTGWGVEFERHPRFFRKSHITWPSEIHVVPRFEAAVVDLPPASPSR